MGEPKIVQAEFTRETLPGQYVDLLLRNPLLARIEATLRSMGGWTDEQIRTAQLLTAVTSNASLQARLAEMMAARRPVIAGG